MHFEISLVNLECDWINNFVSLCNTRYSVGPTVTSGQPRKSYSVYKNLAAILASKQVSSLYREGPHTS